MTTHVLRPAPPLRSYVVAAVLAVLGVAMLIGSRFGANLWLLLFGALVLVDGLALLVVMRVSARRARVVVDLDDNGYVVHGRDGDVRGTWDSVTKVTRSDDGSQLVFHQGPERRLVLIGRDVTTLENDVVRYLDRSRGYGGAVG
ncbi:MAG TPA: hypothetical protein VFK68_00590 [Propionibacteriaceae bacterium]|nr:hypothetical protein [Propionibacteriaceae bacterium]